MLRDKQLSADEYTENQDFILAAMMYEDDDQVPGSTDMVPPPPNMPSSESSCPLLTAAGWQIKGGDGEDFDQTQKALGSRSAAAKPPPPSARPALRKRHHRA